MKTVIEMAREAGGGLESDYINISALERLVELVRADEREKYKWDVLSCGPTCTKVACVAVREAVKAERDKWMERTAILIRGEREACAKACEDFNFRFQDDSVGSLQDAAEAIRARSNT